MRLPIAALVSIEVRGPSKKLGDEWVGHGRVQSRCGERHRPPASSTVRAETSGNCLSLCLGPKVHLTFGLLVGRDPEAMSRVLVCLALYSSSMKSGELSESSVSSRNSSHPLMRTSSISFRSSSSSSSSGFLQS